MIVEVDAIHLLNIGSASTVLGDGTQLVIQYLCFCLYSSQRFC